MKKLFAFILVSTLTAASFANDDWKNKVSTPIFLAFDKTPRAQYKKVLFELTGEVNGRYNEASLKARFGIDGIVIAGGIFTATLNLEQIEKLAQDPDCKSIQAATQVSPE